MPLPTDNEDVDVENKLLDEHDSETSSRRSSETSEETRPKPKGYRFQISKSWLLLTIFNTILVCVSVILNKNAYWDFTRSCIRETSAYCRNSLSYLKLRRA